MVECGDLNFRVFLVGFCLYVRLFDFWVLC